jgi:hypothetical protein
MRDTPYGSFCNQDKPRSPKQGPRLPAFSSSLVTHLLPLSSFAKLSNKKQLEVRNCALDRDYSIKIKTKIIVSFCIAYY